MTKAKVWRENITMPTYGVGEPDKNPMFLEKRVYQGSSGKVYPLPVIDKILDDKQDKTYQAVFLENEYLQITLLPELGGRVQRALDKTNGYDFVYYNHVIKPALVGLTGPWISGGIEFNWPQHHRPNTYGETDCSITENEDGSATVHIGETDRMYGTRSICSFTLHPGKAYLQIDGECYNPTTLPQTFLWWANPAVAVNDYTQSIFPPDVHAVMDHGKRAVSAFPIATGVYYKHDYSAGVDISRYKNIPVPTSYMAYHSDYDFVGNYDHKRQAGLLHVADHQISPGKKQWTWGCGEFGKAWDRNLTDEDGPYIELMAGVFTDNQPDFTWLKPFETKRFTQVFMPYKKVGAVKNANEAVAVNLEGEGSARHAVVYASSVINAAQVVISRGETVVFETACDLSPTDVFESTFEAEGLLRLCVYNSHGELLIDYQEKKPVQERIPDPAKAALAPDEITTNEELLLTGLHLEQYRHATYAPESYYQEGLRRDPSDCRINNAYGSVRVKHRVSEIRPVLPEQCENLRIVAAVPAAAQPISP